MKFNTFTVMTTLMALFAIISQNVVVLSVVVLILWLVAVTWEKLIEGAFDNARRSIDVATSLSDECDKLSKQNRTLRQLCPTKPIPRKVTID